MSESNHSEMEGILIRRRSIVNQLRQEHNMYSKYDDGQQNFPDAKMNRVEVPDSARKLLPQLVQGGENGEYVKWLQRLDKQTINALIYAPDFWKGEDANDTMYILAIVGKTYWWKVGETLYSCEYPNVGGEINYPKQGYHTNAKVCQTV